MVATLDATTTTIRDDSALMVESTLLDKDSENKTVAESILEPEIATQTNGEQITERVDIENERVDTPTEDETTTDVTENDALSVPGTGLLDRYGFGAGMRMYARSVALAELAEAERAAAAKKVADNATEDKDSEPEPEDLSVTVPLSKSVIDFESVRSELSRYAQEIASMGSIGRNSKKSNKSELRTKQVERAVDEDDDVVDDTSRTSSELARSSKGCCGADEALNEIFREAELWAAKTYTSMSSSSKSIRQASSKKTSTKSWFSFLFPKRKDGKEVKECLNLDEDNTAAKTSRKIWWKEILCEPVILDELTNSSQTVENTELAAATEEIPEAES